MYASGFDSGNRYLAHIQSPHGANELLQLIGRTTVGETYFFRNENHWRSFREFVLPQIKKNRIKDKQSLAIWSAGCSTGDEPYTIAMVLLEENLIPPVWDVRIHATDIDRDAIDFAQKGLYYKNAFRGVEQRWIDKYFILEKGRYRIIEAARKMVSFERFNLITAASYPPRCLDLDIIFCRNVLMYLRPEIYRRVIRKFTSALKDDGFLFLGHAEGRIVHNTAFTPVKCCDTFVFRKSTAYGGKQPGSHLVKRIRDEQETRAGLATPDSAEKKRQGHKRRRQSERPAVSKHAPAGNRKNLPDGGLKDNATPNSTPYAKALEYYLKEDFKAALEELPKRKSQDLRTLILSALICINLSDFTTTESLLHDALAITDVSPEVHQVRAMLLETQGNLEAAASANRAAIFLDGDFFPPHFRLGHIYQSQGEAATARKHFSNALRVLGNDDENRVKLFCGKTSMKLLKDICRKRCRAS
jgi:chemotaxis protein methyltransferase CheR